MSYTALYRKFRPASFAEVKGQDHIVTTLRNQLKAGRIGHAYLFTGTRGTGKTSVAKIFAKTVNCENPTEDGPCGECRICKAIAAGATSGEIAAAIQQQAAQQTPQQTAQQNAPWYKRVLDVMNQHNGMVDAALYGG